MQSPQCDRRNRAEVTKVAQVCSLDVDVTVAVDEGVLIPAGHAGELAFAHPLLRAVAYRRMRDSVRRSIHAAAATICQSATERAWHLAETAEGPDEAIAAKLEDAVHDLVAAGAPFSAVPLAERALGLTDSTEPSALFRRRLLLVDALRNAGDIVRARSVVRDLMKTAAPGRQRAEALWRRAVYIGSERMLQERIDDLDAALRELAWTPDSVAGVAPADRLLAMELLQEYAGMLGRNRGQGAAALPLATQAVALADASGDIRLRAQAEALRGNLEMHRLGRRKAPCSSATGRR